MQAQTALPASEGGQKIATLLFRFDRHRIIIGIGWRLLACLLAPVYN